MSPAERERWRIHPDRASRGRGEPCWGPNACQRCVEIGNDRPERGRRRAT